MMRMRWSTLPSPILLGYLYCSSVAIELISTNSYQIEGLLIRHKDLIGLVLAPLSPKALIGSVTHPRALGSILKAVLP